MFLALSYVGSELIERAEPDLSQHLQPAEGAKFITTRSGRVHVIDVGEGPAILLLHGSGRSVSDWGRGVVARLSESHRVIAIDYYGMGYSDRSDRFVYGYDLWVQEAVDVLDALDIKAVMVVGHSVGGMIACVLAAEHPDRVNGVVTIGTGMEIEPQQFLLAAPGVGEIFFARLPYYGVAYSPSQEDALRKAFRVRGTRRALVQYMRRQLTVDGLKLVTGVIEDIKAPLLHLSGSEDRNISPRAARALSQRSGGEFVLIDGVAHDVPMLAPERLSTEIKKFATGIEAAGRNSAEE